jgi:hypothetical protein
VSATGFLATIRTIAWGATRWQQVRPWRLLKELRNVRRARLGKPLLEITPEDDSMRKTGVLVATVSPVLAVIATALGAPAECAPEAIDMGCVSAAQIAGSIGTLLGGVVYVVGAWRADKRNGE